MLSFPLVILSDYHSDIGGAFFLGPCALSFQAAVLMICWIVSMGIVLPSGRRCRKMAEGWIYLESTEWH